MAFPAGTLTCSVDKKSSKSSCQYAVWLAGNIRARIILEISSQSKDSLKDPAWKNVKIPVPAIKLAIKVLVCILPDYIPVRVSIFSAI